MTNPYGQQQQQPYGQQPQQFGQPPQFGQPQQPYGTPSGGMPAAPYGQPVQPGQPGQPQYPQYGQQAPFGQPYGQPGAVGQDIPDYKGWAIGCIFLFWILAIFAIMKSNEVNTYKMQGNLAAAQDASRQTRTLCLIATIIGAISWAIAVIMIIVAIVAANEAVDTLNSYNY
ncbi:interferon-induced transmembrane protein [Prauserella shujinwangii]|uniref:Interferon-induced transmembrane protein n=1 Tax=Prauserella shujinwangii TaxID=1453103 RepID=A0A2T0LTM8_9PSEU|nr:CD225/dispanin family protein [Prauserella shujinwangii]PRX47098.1 interferon-induced transmembrane protein [Prauserella shujinwangii]